MVEVLRCDSTHKYLGRLFCGDLRRRAQCNLSHRLACGWLKFHHMAATLLNKKIPIHLRLKLFDSVITPAVCYSLSTTPLTSSMLSKLDAAQRKMLRKIVGWICYDDETWEAAGQRMKARLEAALQRRPVRAWSEVRHIARRRLLDNLAMGHAPIVAQLACKWSPRDTFDHLRHGIAHRRPGRPSQRWQRHAESTWRWQELTSTSCEPMTSWRRKLSLPFLKCQPCWMGQWRLQTRSTYRPMSSTHSHHAPLTWIR